MSFTQAMIVGASGKTAQTSEQNQLIVDTRHAAMFAGQKGDAYTLLVDVTSAGVDEDFFMIKNNDARDLIIFQMAGWFDDASQEVSILLGATDDGTGAGDTITAANMRGGGVAANVDAVQDATNLAYTGGTGVALLKGHTTALIETVWEFPSGIILPSGSRCHGEASLAGLLNLNISFFFRDAV